jgi:hypothetical protein
VDELVDDAVVTLFAVTAAASWFLCHILFLILFRKHGLLKCRRLFSRSPAAKSGLL